MAIMVSTLKDKVYKSDDISIYCATPSGSPTDHDKEITLLLPYYQYVYFPKREA